MSQWAGEQSFLVAQNPRLAAYDTGPALGYEHLACQSGDLSKENVATPLSSSSLDARADFVPGGGWRKSALD